MADPSYTWLRDAGFTLNSLDTLGCHREAHAYAAWLLATIPDAPPPLNVMYGIGGRADLSEHDIAHADGYKASRPVRVRNAAEHQLQLDSYGELLDGVGDLRGHGRPCHLRRMGRVPPAGRLRRRPVAAARLWLVEALDQAGRGHDALALFDRLCDLAGPPGLFSEMIDPHSGAHLGNYPQPFTHIGLINAGLRPSRQTAREARHAEPVNDGLATTRGDLA